MPEKLFVGGLPFDYSDDQLKSLFAKVGTVLSASMVPDPKNKRTRGFGFVTLSGKEEAITALKKLNGTKVGEKNIYISEAREKTPRRDAPPPRWGAAPRSPRVGDNRKPSFGAPARDRRPSRPHGFSAPPEDKRSSFGPAPRERKSPRGHGRSDKPAKKPFYQKFAKPE